MSGLVNNSSYRASSGFFSAPVVAQQGGITPWHLGEGTQNPRPRNSDRIPGTVYSRSARFPHKPKGKTLEALRKAVQEQKDQRERAELARVKDRPEYVETTHAVSPKSMLTFSPPEARKVLKYIAENFTCLGATPEQSTAKIWAMLRGEQELKILIGEGHHDMAGWEAIRGLLDLLEDNGRHTFDILVEHSQADILNRSPYHDVACFYRASCFGVDLAGQASDQESEQKLLESALRVIYIFDRTKAQSYIKRISSPETAEDYHLHKISISDAFSYVEKYYDRQKGLKIVGLKADLKTHFEGTISDFLKVSARVEEEIAQGVPERDAHSEVHFRTHPRPFVGVWGLLHVETQAQNEALSGIVFLCSKTVDNPQTPKVDL